MPETPETEDRVAKIQKDVEELKEDLQDSWHLNRERYERMVSDVLKGDPICTTLYLEIDGLRSIIEIEGDLSISGHRVPHPTLWRASQKLMNGGLIRKIGVKFRSPIFAKKSWALALRLDDYVREFSHEENKSQS
jgi:hypothetical protein